MKNILILIFSVFCISLTAQKDEVVKVGDCPTCAEIRACMPLPIPPPNVTSLDESVGVETIVNEDGSITYDLSVPICELEPRGCDIINDDPCDGVVTERTWQIVNCEYVSTDKVRNYEMGSCPVFHVGGIDDTREECFGTGNLDLIGDDTPCPYGMSYYSIDQSSITPAGYTVTVDAITGDFVFQQLDPTADCEAVNLMFTSTLHSECGDVPAEYIIPIDPPPTGSVIASKEMEFVEGEDGEQLIQITSCATNDPDATGDLATITSIDPLDPLCFTNVIDPSNNPHITIAGNTVNYLETGLSVAPGQTVCYAVLAEKATDKLHYTNVVDVDAVDESGNDSSDAAPDVLTSLPEANSKVTSSQPTESGNASANFEQSKSDGSPITTCECSRQIWRTESGVIIYEIQGDLCTDVSAWDFISGAYDPTGQSAIFSGSAANGGQVGYNKKDLAIAAGLTGENAEDWIIETYVGGSECSNPPDLVACPSESSNEDNFVQICTFRTFGFDNTMTGCTEHDVIIGSSGGVSTFDLMATSADNIQLGSWTSISDGAVSLTGNFADCSSSRYGVKDNDPSYAGAGAWGIVDVTIEGGNTINLATPVPIPDTKPFFFIHQAELVDAVIDLVGVVPELNCLTVSSGSSLGDNLLNDFGLATLIQPVTGPEPEVNGAYVKFSFCGCPPPISYTIENSVTGDQAVGQFVEWIPVRY